MKHLKRNLILIFIVNAVLLAGCLIFTFSKMMAHPQLSFGMIILLFIDFIILSSFITLITIGVRLITMKIKNKKQNKN